MPSKSYTTPPAVQREFLMKHIKRTQKKHKGAEQRAFEKTEKKNKESLRQGPTKVMGPRARETTEWFKQADAAEKRERERKKSQQPIAHSKPSEEDMVAARENMGFITTSSGNRVFVGNDLKRSKWYERKPSENHHHGTEPSHAKVNVGNKSEEALRNESSLHQQYKPGGTKYAGVVARAKAHGIKGHSKKQQPQYQKDAAKIKAKYHGK